MNPRSLFSQIVKGYSLDYFNNHPIYFKHFDNIVLGDFSDEEKFIYDKAKNEGLLTEKEKIEQLIKDGVWTEVQEREIKQEKEFIEIRSQTKKNLLIESQIAVVNKEIESSQEKVNQLLCARANLVGYVVESYSQRKINEKHIQSSTYKSKELLELLFNEEEFNELEDSQLEELIISYNNKIDYINKNIKKLAISPFFQNLYHTCGENIYNFYGKSVVELTIFQLDSFIYGKFFANIISNNNPPQELLEDPDKLIEWSTQSKNFKDAIGEQKADLSGGSVMGAKAADYKKAGVAGKVVNFRKKLQDGKNELDSIELAQIFQSN